MYAQWQTSNTNKHSIQSVMAKARKVYTIKLKYTLENTYTQRGEKEI